MIVHALDGYDEISLTGPFKYFYNQGERIATPEDWDLPLLNHADILGGESIEDSAEIFLTILEGKGTPEQNAAVIANSGLALFCCNQKAGINTALEHATDSLQSGKALDAFKKLINS